MANTKSPIFEEMVENTKKAFDFWTDLSKSMTNSLSSTFSDVAATNAGLNSGYDFYQEWYNKQKSLFEEAAKITDPKEAFVKGPDYFKRWANNQMEFTQKATELYRENAAKYGVTLPTAEFKAPAFKTTEVKPLEWWNPATYGFSSPAAAPELPKSFEEGLKVWQNWLGESAKWITNNIASKMPASMQPHLTNFTSIYGNLFQYWDSFAKMIQFNATTKDTLEKFFSPDAYKDIVNKFMGFYGGTYNLNELLERGNKTFEQYMEMVSRYAPTAANMTEYWRNVGEAWTSKSINPFFKMALEFNQRLHNDLGPLYNVAGQGREVEMAKLVRDIQFTWVNFAVKSSEMQTMLYKAGQNVLPELIKSYAEEFQQTKVMPEYQAFFKTYINRLEDALMVVLRSAEYSTIQSEVAATSVSLKGKMGKLMEMAFVNLPFLTQSDGDDIAQENSALRKKITQLEYKLAAIEAKIGGSVSVATPSSTLVSSTTSNVTPNVTSSTSVTTRTITAVPSVQATAAVPTTSYTRTTIVAPGELSEQDKIIARKTLLTNIGVAAATERDDLKLIKGIGPKLEELLNSIGIYTFEQVSRMTEQEYELVDSLLMVFVGRAKRDEWALQAKELLRATV